MTPATGDIMKLLNLAHFQDEPSRVQQFAVRDSAVFTSMYSRKKQEEMIYGTPGSGANQPGRFFSYYSVGPLNYCRIDDPRVNEVIEAAGNLGWDLYTDREGYAAILTSSGR